LSASGSSYRFALKEVIWGGPFFVKRSLPRPLSKNFYYFAGFADLLNQEVGKTGGMIEFLEGGSRAPRYYML
jgi:hypothetical protein